MAATLTPVVYGPSDLPELSLGWDVLNWCTRNLTNDSGGAFVFTDEQARFVVQWYGIDEDGKWLYQRGVLRRIKGWGKDPLAAALAVCEWIGPCRLGGWRRDGSPITVPQRASWIQVAGATANQAEQNTMSLFGSMVPQKLVQKHRLSIGIQKCWASNKRRIEAVSNASRGIEGARPTFVIMGETQHWVGANGGIALAEVLQRNLIKSPRGVSRSLSITNAHMDGEGSVAELEWDARDADGVLYDSIEAPTGLDPNRREDVVAGILAARGDSEWLDVERITAAFFDTITDQAHDRRYFWNQIVAGAGKWMDPSTWSAATVPGEPPEKDSLITLGFDGSRFRDATALVGTDLQTGWQWIAGLWERDVNDPNWEVPLGEVDAVVMEAAQRWFITRFYADPSWWEETVSRWQAAITRRDGKAVVAAWYTGGAGVVRMARAVRAYMDAVEDQS